MTHFFVARGDGEPEFDEEDDDDEGDDKGYNENRKSDEFEGNDVGLFAFAEYDEDDKEADVVWEASTRGWTHEEKIGRNEIATKEINYFRELQRKK
ncbi:hypothetical protein CDL15_Pgr006824 [Punica granatum]|uniref:PRP1 splicing factor N-terminal domain-containing protein n=1 Tax=Punica granatum TaxID=22663 RepID=A0A218X763_PUNGR|nr:hypothetical protein CDL15_Pgr006824 [Punica granatum]